MRMYAEIEFDREIDSSKHYICPGGYEVQLTTGEVISFDFEEFIGCVSEDNPKVLINEQRHLDTVAFPESIGLDPRKIEKFLEFYVYTGEHDEAEINPVRVLSLAFDDEKGVYEIPESIIKTIEV